MTNRPQKYPGNSHRRSPQCRERRVTSVKSAARDSVPRHVQRPRGTIVGPIHSGVYDAGKGGPVRSGYIPFNNLKPIRARATLS